MFLLEDFDDRFEYGQLILKVDMAYENVLAFYEAVNDPELNDAEKILIGLEILIDNYECIEDLNLEEKYRLFVYVLKEFINEDIENEDAENDNEEDLNDEDQKESKTFDFSIDSERIYSSFMYDYNIDLFEERGKLHWKKFIALFNGLSDDTVFKRVINIRTMEIPKPSKGSNKERNKIIKLKSQYSLEEENNDGINSALDKVSKIFKKQ